MLCHILRLSHPTHPTLSWMGTKETTESAMGASTTKGLAPPWGACSPDGAVAPLPRQVSTHQGDPCQRAAYPHHSCRRVNLGQRDHCAPACCEPDNVDGGVKHGGGRIH